MRFLLALGAVAAACAPSDESPDATSLVDAHAEESGSIVARSGVSAFFDCLRENDLTVVSAHRGGPRPGFPENAIETMADVLKSTPAIMEIDVAATSDGELVLLHDDDLDRTTTGTGPIADRPYADVAKLMLEDNSGDLTPFRAPKLAEALDWSAGRTILQIDFKRSVRYEDVIDEVREEGAENRVIYISYTLAQARRLNALAPDSMLSVGIETIDDLESVRAAGIPLNRVVAWTGTAAPNAALVAALQEEGVESAFGTLGGRRSIDNAIAASGDNRRYLEIAELDVRVIATDRPREAAAVLPSSDACGIDFPG